MRRPWRCRPTLQADEGLTNGRLTPWPQVLVDMASPVWWFSLQPNNQLSDRRVWNLRAPS